MRPPGPRQERRAIEQLCLQARERFDVARLLGPGHVGMAADRSRRRTGRIDQNRVERLRLNRRRRRRPQLPRAAVAARDWRRAASGARPNGPERRTCARASAICAVLPPGAAHMSSTRSSGPRREQARRQSGGGVLHPPFAVRIAGKLADRRVGAQPHRACRQHDAVEPLRPALRIVLDVTRRGAARACASPRWRAPASSP